MMHAFMQLEDGTEIVHSDAEMVDGKEQVKVYMEKPVHLGFKSVWCVLPDYQWKDNEGFTDEEMDNLKDIVESTAHLIIRFARQGGLGNAANF